MKWLLIILGISVVMILGMLVVGLCQPVKHSVTRSIHLKQKPEAVFAVLENVGDMAKWSTSIGGVEPLGGRDGQPSWRVTLKWGQMQMVMTQLERTRPVRLITSMAKEGGPSLGTWTYRLADEGDGCRIAVTEEGEIANPFFRVLARIRGLDANIAQTLRDLGRKFGEEPRLQMEQ